MFRIQKVTSIKYNGDEKISYHVQANYKVLWWVDNWYDINWYYNLEEAQTFLNGIVVNVKTETI